MLDHPVYGKRSGQFLRIHLNALFDRYLNCSQFPNVRCEHLAAKSEVE
jgi:hypothetical protein